MIICMTVKGRFARLSLMSKMSWPVRYYLRQVLGFRSELPSDTEVRLHVFGEPNFAEGQSGELVGKMLAAMGLTRQDVNLLEMGQMKLPEGLCLFLGREPAQSNGLIGSNLGVLNDHASGKFLVTYSPAELLKKPDLKRQAWAHLQVLMGELRV